MFELLPLASRIAFQIRFLRALSYLYRNLPIEPYIHLAQIELLGVLFSDSSQDEDTFVKP